MEKTGAERVKYSLACQHEDAISIKFVSYAQKCPTVLCTFAVALRKESVDRNYNLVLWVLRKVPVALRKESVDRNPCCAGRTCNACQSLSARRAWIEIECMGVLGCLGCWSLSARRAWIEMKNSGDKKCPCRVALRKESVDRNSTYVTRLPRAQVSLSARRAWIEISGSTKPKARRAVALRKESVDRNSTYVTRLPRAQGRSPQGERG